MPSPGRLISVLVCKVDWGFPVKSVEAGLQRDIRCVAIKVEG